MTEMARRAYADMYGPTVGDRMRLADTELVIEIEQDFTLRAGVRRRSEVWRRQTIRDSMGQSQRSRAQGALDTVITNAVVIDHWGIVKADIGLRDGRIVRA